MSTEPIWQTKSTSLKETLDLAEAIGSRLRGGEVIELASDLGGGKTAFTRGLAAGMGSKDVVHSPSFTINNVYRSDDLVLYHFDFYRLPEPGIIADELAEVINDPKAVIVIEWADIVEGILPEARLSIKISTISEHHRNFDFTYPESLNYLIPNNT